MAFASEWQPDGAAKYSADAVGRDASASRCSSRRSTPAPEPSSSRADQRLRRQQRLTRGSDLRATVRTGKRLRTTNLDLRVVLATGAVSRIGFVVPKHGHSSVERNRLKRRLRELGRLGVLDLVPGAGLGSAIDVVMRAQPGAYGLEYVQLRSEVEVLRARLLKHLGDSRGDGRAGEAAEPPHA
jgi:ribonuclease P protein component